MNIRNHTTFSVSTAIREAVLDCPAEDLTVELKYCRKGSNRYASGTYYRRTRDYEDGKLIRVRINRDNRYPVEVPFKTSEYYTKRNARGEKMIYQRRRNIRFHTPEDLILGIFLHEFSHYLDHIEGRNGRFKQTKADKFAMNVLQHLGVI
ncbi:MAG: hypothetical protein A2Z18_07795 [Armatimonadetes bacterium RBG_16_58_9]|nr:MAG: hypothetical protein A2Z18_07795 [Armatimonadetes bacterium RBG_16_58_9]